MRILIASSQYPPNQGGGGTHAFYLASELAAMGCRVQVLTSTSRGQPAAAKVNSNLTIHRVDFGDKSVIAGTEAVRKGLDLCREFKPDVIHGQHIQGGNIAARLKSVFHVPLVITIHKTPRLQFEDELVTLDPTYSEIRFLTTIGLCDCFVAGSRAFLSELTHLAGSISRPPRIQLIYHGVSQNWLQFRAYRGAKTPLEIGLNLPRNAQLVICPARIDRRKNLDLFVWAGAETCRRLPGLDLRFLITGEPSCPAEDRYKRELMQQAASLGIPGKLIFKAFDFSLLPCAFRFASACVLPSYKEGLGLVLLEAMALRVPVISTKTIGIDEVVSQSGNGALLFELGEPEDLVNHLIRTLTDPKAAAALRRTGSQLVRERFSGRRMAEQHLALYSSLLSAAGSSS
jgi:glycosyltransferase involved in cell wall biosynthesis